MVSQTEEQREETKRKADLAKWKKTVLNKPLTLDDLEKAMSAAKAVGGAEGIKF